LKLPSNTVIAKEKATEYLLVPQARGDKSAFLELAGYTRVHAEQLLGDLREQLRFVAVPTKSNKFTKFAAA
jgi:hypothetical protein